MRDAPLTFLSAPELRREISARNLVRAEAFQHEVTYGGTPSVIYSADEGGAHGNFLPASFRRIAADPLWSARLDKAYTASRRVARSTDRRRGELECANSSDALLMNIFCFPGILHRPGVCRLLGVRPGLRPEFGYRGQVPFARRGTDRTEIDMRLGDCLFEAKLTETGFQQARGSLVERYRDLHSVFDVEELPRSGELYDSYQLLRGTLAAAARTEQGSRFVVLADARRRDLAELWFRVMRAVRTWELRGRLSLLTWQELAAELPGSVQAFLSEKYGIEPAR